MKKSFCLLVASLVSILILFPIAGVGQTTSGSSTETLWSNGKIFVVLIVAAIIFSGIGIFLIALERKISRVEKKILDKKL